MINGNASAVTAALIPPKGTETHIVHDTKFDRALGDKI